MRLYEQTLKGIKSLDEAAMHEASQRLDSLIKPIGSLGRLEEIAIRLSGMTGKVKNEIKKKCVVVMCADNGVWEEGVSACPQDITAVQTINFLRGITGIAVLARHAGSEIKVIDIGVNKEMEYPGLIHKKIRMGTSNMSKGPAMSREEAIKAVEVGIEAVEELVKDGFGLIGTGEMGICNTSTSSAILMSFTGCSADFAVGKGAGLSEEGYENKKNTIKKAMDINKPDANDPLDVLAKVGGLDIAGMAGCFLGAAYHRVPIVIDGFISAAAALVAFKLNPLAREFMIPSHCSEEPGYKYLMEELGLSPMLNLRMRLGEGTGCPLAFNIIEAAAKIINEMASFDDIKVSGDFLVDIRN
ncbi:MAG: nicotinate-nucleotide--dimethylbenzimidazole phosphoribosyltransferase [Clostridia bacterium]|nr:nicotinate-nucleotide--dimethylbenzimidazole phosphoribosyltransferase [Clostridia bacterium]